MTLIELILIGTGGVGRNVSRLVRERPGYHIVAAYSRAPEHSGRDLGELAGGTPLGIAVADRRDAVLAHHGNILLIATTSFLAEVAPDIRAGIERGLNVITTAEEAAFPWIIDPRLADEIDQLARANDVSVLGVGLNPGFIFDALLLTASAVAWDVSSISIRRMVDVSGFSPTIQQRLGIGFSASQFAAGVESGSITGHIGFPQSFHLAATSIGKEIQSIDKAFAPLLAERAIEGGELAVAAGTTAGFLQRYTATCDGRPWMTAEFVAHVAPESAGYQPVDDIRIDGHNPLHLTIDPGCQPQLGTAAMLANVMPRVLEARAGFITVADLALPHARPTAGFGAA